MDKLCKFGGGLDELNITNQFDVNELITKPLFQENMVTKRLFTGNYVHERSNSFSGSLPGISSPGGVLMSPGLFSGTGSGQNTPTTTA